MIGLIHAYSRTNAGDGFLVDLTLQRLRRINVTPDEVLMVALDPDSYPEVPRRVKVGALGRRVSAELGIAASRGVGLAASSMAGLSVGAAARELDKCRSFVAVGGGYLRSVGAISSAGALLNHVPQLVFASRAGVPSLYLPQSIGPLRGLAGRLIARSLRRVDAVCVRDRWSRAELAGLSNIRRVPDLAVLDVADRWSEIDTAGSDHQVGIVARRVRHAADYENHLRTLSRRLGDRAVWAVQTAGDPTESDVVHYERLGVTAGGDLKEMLEGRRLSIVVSVRLHGALMAIGAGVPAIHLAYDRKGPGAFEDLGLDEWCFDVRTLNPAALNTAVDGLLTDPGRYWDHVARRVPELQAASAELDALVSRTLG
jgi:polysaccharide pyruvyl transferase WcaK-like protein